MKRKGRLHRGRSRKKQGVDVPYDDADNHDDADNNVDGHHVGKRNGNLRRNNPIRPNYYDDNSNFNDDLQQYNATRFAQEPLPQPMYGFAHVPVAARDMTGSSLQHVQDRHQFQTCMAEMLLLCKEAMRRRRNKILLLKSQQAEVNLERDSSESSSSSLKSSTTKTGTTASSSSSSSLHLGGSKPLLLEYLADRLDIDDPVFGFLVRTESPPATASPHWQRGMLQGFITVTTFTTWQKTIRWDSAHEAAFSADDAEELQIGQRQWDRNGDLARDIQNTVHAGNIWDEGIVWPHLAEISLLGGLGCGAALVSLVVERLEGMGASGKANYDFVVLQATDNSVPFYEAMGFVRVGVVMQTDNNNQSENRDATKIIKSTQQSKSSSKKQTSSQSQITVDDNGDCDDQDVAVDALPQDSPTKSVAAPSGFVTSPVAAYTIQKKGGTPSDVAKKLSVSVWDIIFLNREMFEGIAPNSRLMKGTVLIVPLKPQTSTPPQDSASVQPEWYIAKENDTPRMIARKFNVSCLDLVEANKGRLPGLVSSSRLKSGTRMKVSRLDELETANWKPYSHWSFPDDEFEDGEPSYMMARRLKRRKGADAKSRPFESSLAIKVTAYEPPTLVMPPSPRPTRSTEHIASTAIATDETAARDSSGRPDSMPTTMMHPQTLPHESNGLPTTPRLSIGNAMPLAPRSATYSLYNTVVRLKSGAMTEGSEYKYWYVLTFIPDLKWCHLAPMEIVGIFGPDKTRAQGRPKYKLVDESLGKEVDISSSFCVPVRSRFMKRTQDADKEEWDIVDDLDTILDSTTVKETSHLCTSAFNGSLASSLTRDRSISLGRSSKARIILNTAALTAVFPVLAAVMPRSNVPVAVRLSGSSLIERVADTETPTTKRGRGRPKGSKNKLKSPPMDDLCRDATSSVTTGCEYKPKTACLPTDTMCSSFESQAMNENAQRVDASASTFEFKDPSVNSVAANVPTVSSQTTTIAPLSDEKGEEIRIQSMQGQALSCDAGDPINHVPASSVVLSGNGRRLSDKLIKVDVKEPRTYRAKRGSGRPPQEKQIVSKDQVVHEERRIQVSEADPCASVLRNSVRTTKRGRPSNPRYGKSDSSVDENVPMSTDDLNCPASRHLSNNVESSRLEASSTLVQERGRLSWVGTCGDDSKSPTRIQQNASGLSNGVHTPQSETNLDIRPSNRILRRQQSELILRSDLPASDTMDVGKDCRQRRSSISAGSLPSFTGSVPDRRKRKVEPASLGDNLPIKKRRGMLRS